MIPAAAKAAFSLGNDMQDWGKVPEVVRARYLEEATLALEAAAPYMLPDFREPNRKAVEEEIANPLRLRKAEDAH